MSTQPLSDAEVIAQLRTLVEEWRQSAKYALANAKAEPEEWPRKFIEHGGICYANCVMAVDQLLENRASPSPALGTLSGSRTSTTPQT